MGSKLIQKLQSISSNEKRPLSEGQKSPLLTYSREPILFSCLQILFEKRLRVIGPNQTRGFFFHPSGGEGWKKKTTKRSIDFIFSFKKWPASIPHSFFFPFLISMEKWTSCRHVLFVLVVVYLWMGGTGLQDFQVLFFLCLFTSLKIGLPRDTNNKGDVCLSALFTASPPPPFIFDKSKIEASRSPSLNRNCFFLFCVYLFAFFRSFDGVQSHRGIDLRKKSSREKSCRHFVLIDFTI